MMIVCQNCVLEVAVRSGEVDRDDLEELEADVAVEVEVEEG